MCQEDVWRLWVAMAQMPGEYHLANEIYGMSINLIAEIPEGIVIVS